MPWPTPVPTENHESFLTRITPFFAPSQICMIDLGYMLAKHAHRYQVRKELDEHGDPVRYFEHVRRATLIGIDLAKIVLYETTVTLIFHDSFEDCRLLTPQHIEAMYGPDICTLIKLVSKVPKDGYLDRFFMSTDWRGYFCKGCDRLDNLRSLSDSPVEFRRKQVTETKDKYYRLFDRMVTLAPEQHRDGVGRLREAIHETTESVSVVE